MPAAILHRPKQGFEMPVDAWLRGPLQSRFQDEVLGQAGPLDGLIDRQAALEVFERHRKGLGQHGGTLWALLVLSAWKNRYLCPGSRP